MRRVRYDYHSHEIDTYIHVLLYFRIMLFSDSMLEHCFNNVQFDQIMKGHIVLSPLHGITWTT